MFRSFHGSLVSETYVNTVFSWISSVVDRDSWTKEHGGLNWGVLHQQLSKPQTIESELWGSGYATWTWYKIQVHLVYPQTNVNGLYRAPYTQLHHSRSKLVNWWPVSFPARRRGAWHETMRYIQSCQPLTINAAEFRRDKKVPQLIKEFAIPDWKCDP